MAGHDIHEKKRALVDQTARLIEFLRRLASTRYAAVRDVDAHPMALFLVDRPLAADLDATAGPGDVLLTIDPISVEPAPRLPEALAGWVDPIEASDSTLGAPTLRQELDEDGEPIGPPSSVVSTYQQWIGSWSVWAEADRLTRPHRDWYDLLADAHQQLDQRSEEVELIIGTGLIAWRAPSGTSTRVHLLATRARIRLDSDTGRLEVLVDPDATTRLGDRDLFMGEDGFDAGRADQIRQQLRTSPPVPLGDEIKDVLERWRSMALTTSHPYEHDAWNPIDEVDDDGVPLVQYAPAIILRRRDAATLIGYYDRMLEVLSGPDAEAPLGLAQLLTALEPEERLAWLEAEGGFASVEPDPLFPLPANDEQRQIIERLRHDTGVVVQGPPGTGKSHSIANLIAALLSQGHRVLVTSQKAQALRVLRDKLPDDVAELCVSMTDLSRGGSAELNRSVNALSERFGSHDPSTHATIVSQLSERRDGERQRVAGLTEQIRALRESETYQHPPIAEGYQGTLATIADKLSQRARRDGWVPVPLSEGAPYSLPLSAVELDELRGLIETETPKRAARAHQSLPDLSTLPTGATVRGWIAAETAAAAAAADARTSASERIAQCDPGALDSIRDHLHNGRRELDAGGLAGGDPSEPWIVSALTAHLDGTDTVVWDQLADWSAQAHEARRQLDAIGLRHVVLPPFAPSGPNSAGSLRIAGQGLRDYLAAGGTLRRHLPKPVQKAAQPLLDSAAIDGVPPSTPELLDIVLAQIDLESTTAALAQRWAAVGCKIDPALPVAARVGRLMAAGTALEAIRRFIAIRDDVTVQLRHAGAPMPLGSIDDWRVLEGAIASVSVQREADQASAHIAEQVSALDLRTRTEASPPELAEAVLALSIRDPAAYEAALQGIADGWSEQAAQRRRDELTTPLREAHPGLLQLLESTAGSLEWSARLPGCTDAWAWARARTFFDAQRQPGLDARLDAELADAVARVEAATARLAAARAWGHALERMNASQAQALHVYRQAMSDRGAGKGRYAHRYEAAAREAMVAARGAVPAWIMPLPEVLETVPPDRNSFDVVIVDEASQASIEALFLLWLAPRVIVVGDDRQCTPSQVSHGELQPIFDSLEDHLPDVPQYLRVAFTPRSSLFSLLTTRFGSVLRLREHFRCMPEIIGWSSRQFYADAPLIPLRQYGGDRLPPLRTTHVPEAFSEGTATRVRNPREAAAIADAIADCIKDPAYDDRTMGVVVLQGSGQIALIQNLLHDRLPAQVWEQRRLRVGSPPDFQGDERDIVFMSMVVAEPPRAVTMLDWQRRFNVAASRARDQLWLFHSVTLDALSPTDLRRSLLAYMAHPPATESAHVLDDVRDDEPHREFDSLFEQRVFNRIRARGYNVTPQVEVNGRRIDLVVTGAKGRLAIECDGDAWHSSAEQREADLHRELELKRAGWRFWRVRESEYYWDPEAAMAGLWEALEIRGINPGDLVVVDGLATQGDPEWVPSRLSEVEGADGLEDDPADASGLDAPVPIRQCSTGAGIEPSRAPSLATWPVAPTSRETSSPDRPSASEVRNWARLSGLVVGERGRLHPHVISAWNQQNPDRPYR